MKQSKIMNSARAFNELKKSLQGIAKILEINLDNEDYLYLAGMDNIVALGEAIPDLLKNAQKKNFINLIEKIGNIQFNKTRSPKNTEITK